MGQLQEEQKEEEEEEQVEREMSYFECCLSAVGVASAHNTHCSMSCKQCYMPEGERGRGETAAVVAAALADVL